MSNIKSNSYSPKALIRDFLKNRDFDSAARYISKNYQSIGLNDNDASEIIYEDYIKPEEPFYHERYDSNLELLEKSGILFTKLSFKFDDAKKQACTITSCLQKTANFTAFSESINAYFFADINNVEIIQKVAVKDNRVYIAYDNIMNFYHLLLFNDLTAIKQQLSENKIVFFVGRDIEMLQQFFSNFMVLFPSQCSDLSEHKDYPGILEQIGKNYDSKLTTYKQELRDYCKDLNHEYYKELFKKDPSNIKILLITAQVTTINKYIARNWYEAFKDLGYNVMLLHENRRYEAMNANYITEQVCKFKPDIVFHINHPIDGTFQDEEVKRSLLWIMRYRDHTCISRAKPGYEYNNMFILPLFKEWTKDLKRIGIPGNRILYTADGADPKYFSKKGKVNKRYICDVVSVNNQVGNELDILNKICRLDNSDMFRKILTDMYYEIREMALNGEIYILSDYRKVIKEKMSLRDMQVNDNVLEYISFYFGVIGNSFYRRKIIESLIDSGITNNIKLWGSGWSKIEKFRDYHMGIAKHGKELSDIYQGSKISISDQYFVPLHERNFEILASYGFPLVLYVDSDNKERDKITDYFREDEDIVLFNNTDELLSKMQYYLDNPRERERIAENGRKIVNKDFTNKAIVEKTMRFIESYYK